jgi:plastocyanin
MARIIASLALLALLLASCGGGHTVQLPPEVPPGSTVIDQYGLAFKPSAATARAGETVFFLNSETALHTVTIDGKNESGDMRKGEVFSFQFANPGTYRVRCDYHPQMRATITVH